MANHELTPAFPGYTMEEDGETVQVTKLNPGMTLRDYFAAHAEPLDAGTQEWIAAALAGRPMPDRELWERFRAGRCKADDPTREQWLDYHRWWREADVAHRYITADLMLIERAK